MGNFNNRYNYDYDAASEEYLEPVRPGSPTVVRLSVPIITMTPPPPSNPTIVIPPSNLLSVPQNNVNCYKELPENEFNLREDVFQEHQARLINCDSEDASASLQRVLPKVDIVRTANDMEEKSPPDWFIERMERTKENFPSQWVPMANSKSWKSDIYLTKAGLWEFNMDNESSFKRRSVSLDCILDTSSSECDCMVNSQSPQSTDSQMEVRKVEEQYIEDLDEQENEIVSKRKLSNEEREKALRELDEIVSGISRITEFANKDLTLTAQDGEQDPKNSMNDFLSTMLTEPEAPKTEIYIAINESSSSPSSSNEGDFEYGTGRVAALAKHFSEMGEAGIIRGKTIYKRGLAKGNYKSEPNIVISDCDICPRPGDIILPPAAFIDDTSLDNYNLILGTKGLKPVGFSMDRLIDLGHGVIMKESKCDVVYVENNNKPEHRLHIQEGKLSNDTDIIFDKSTQTSPLKVEIPKSKKLSLSESALNDKKDENNVATKIISLPEIHLMLPEPPKPRPPRMSLARKSISVDEVEMRRKSQTEKSHKHYSLVDLGEVDKIETNWLANKEVPKTDSPTNFCASERIHKAYIGDSNGRGMKRWMSVDDAGGKSNGWSERLKEKDKLDFGTSKDTLRKKCKADAIKGRKLKRVKKLELQRSFVVTPVRLCQMGSLDNCNTFWCKPTSGSQPQQAIDNTGGMMDSESRKL